MLLPRTAEFVYTLIFVYISTHRHLNHYYRSWSCVIYYLIIQQFLIQRPNCVPTIRALRETHCSQGVTVIVLATLRQAHILDFFHPSRRGLLNALYIKISLTPWYIVVKRTKHSHKCAHCSEKHFYFPLNLQMFAS